MQIGLQRGVLHIQRLGRRLPLAQTLVLLTQTGIVFIKCKQMADIIHAIAHARQRLRQQAIDRRQHIGQGHACALHHHSVCFAQQQQAERTGDQHRQRQLG